MLSDWLDGIATLIAETTVPDVPARLGVADAAAVLADRIGWDHWQSVDDAILHMPYWVVCEREVSWEHYAIHDLKATGLIEVRYFEHAEQYETIESLTARHLASKRYFLAHAANVIESCAERQARGTNIPLERIELLLPATRTAIRSQDPDTLETDFWEMAWGFFVG